MRTRKCKICRQQFAPRSITHKACSVECAQELAQREKVSAQRKESREKRLKLKTRRQWEKEAQQAVNAWVRLVRDKDKPCISCGRFHQGQMHAGHYLSTGARPELRFDERNIHKQCQPCNTSLSGNLILYRAGLIERCGIEVVEWLEGPHEPLKLTVDQLKEIRDKYRAMLRSQNAT